ncbi:MAG TPA: hypothetical protein VK473_14705 [Terriglobales bacterium]|nr:hypothetical protein [Terriglobales bacterium]
MKKQILLGLGTFGLLTSSLIAGEAPGNARNQQKQDETEEVCEVHPEYSCVQVRKTAQNDKRASSPKKADDPNIARASKHAPIAADRK